MILPCSCDSILTGYFDLCEACQEMVSVAAQDWIKWHQTHPKWERESFIGEETVYYGYVIGSRP